MYFSYMKVEANDEYILTLQNAEFKIGNTFIVKKFLI